MFFDFYTTLLKCAKLINGFRCFPLLYKSWFNWLLIYCLSFHWFYHSANRVKVTSFVLIHSTQFLCHQKDSRVIKHTNQTQTQTQTQIQMVISEKRIWFDQSQVRRSPLLLMMNKTPAYWLKICLTRGVRETTVSPNTTTSHDLPQIVLWKWKMPSKTQINLLTTFIKLTL